MILVVKPHLLCLMQWKRAREKPRTMLCVSFHKLKGASALADSSTGFPTPCPTPLISFMASPVCTRFSSMLSAGGLRKQTQVERELRKLPPSLAFTCHPVPVPCPCRRPYPKSHLLSPAQSRCRSRHCLSCFVRFFVSSGELLFIYF